MNTASFSNPFSLYFLGLTIYQLYLPSPRPSSFYFTVPMHHVDDRQSCTKLHRGFIGHDDLLSLSPFQNLTIEFLSLILISPLATLYLPFIFVVHTRLNNVFLAKNRPVERHGIWGITIDGTTKKKQKIKQNKKKTARRRRRRPTPLALPTLPHPFPPFTPPLPPLPLLPPLPPLPFQP